jgi:hypothetical protein
MFSRDARGKGWEDDWQDADDALVVIEDNEDGSDDRDALLEAIARVRPVGCATSTADPRGPAAGVASAWGAGDAKRGLSAIHVRRSDDRLG